jgi:hypothetical protein
VERGRGKAEHDTIHLSGVLDAHAGLLIAGEPRCVEGADTVPRETMRGVQPRHHVSSGPELVQGGTTTPDANGRSLPSGFLWRSTWNLRRRSA